MAIFKKMNSYLPIIVFLAGMLPILYNIGTLGILEPTEGLIASASRAMLDASNLSTPVLSGVKNFDFPPGVYWITALGIKLFGATELGARFFLAVAAGLTALCIFFIAKLFFGTQCAVISCLLLCTSALFQISFRFLSVTAYSTALESLLCLCFFYYLNKPNTKLRFVFWCFLSIAFLFAGFGVLLPIAALTITALCTGQKAPIKRLFGFWPGILIFAFFGLGWYLLQILVNLGLLKYWLFTLPANDFFYDYHGVPFFAYLLLPIFAVFPWTSIWFKELKSKIRYFKEEPAVMYLVTWAFFPFVVRLLMVSREYTQFMSSLPPLLLLTAPAFQKLYFLKDDNSEETMIRIASRKTHNLILVILASIAGMIMAIWGYANFEVARVVSQTMIFTAIFWLFSAMIMLAFIIKKLNKSVVVPAAILVPSLILFTVPAIQGHEPLSRDSYLPSEHIILKSIASKPKSNFVCCNKILNAWYFYTARKVKLFAVEPKLDFATRELEDLTINSDVESISANITNETYLVLPKNARKEMEKALNHELIFYAEGSKWEVVVLGRRFD